MLTSSSNIRGRWVFRLLIGALLILLLAAIVGIGVPYLAGRARLARLKAIDSECYVAFEPVVPNWLREIVGEGTCHPWDRIWLIEVNVAPNENLELLREFQDLTDIHLQFHGIGDCTPELLAPLKSLTRLRRVELDVPSNSLGIAGNVNLTESGVYELVQCRNLTTLVLDGLDLGENWCRRLRQAESLTQLRVNSREMTVAEIKLLASDEVLQRVRLNAEVAEFKLPPIAKQALNGASNWCVSFETLTPEMFQELAQVKNLGILAINAEAVDQDAFREISRLTRLHALEIKCGMGPVVACIGQMGRCPNLSAFRVEADEIIGSELRGLHSQPMLEQLVLDVQGINPEGFDAISQLTRLTSLRMHLHGNSSAYGSDQLVLENLEEIDLGEGPWPVETLSVLTSALKLRWLRFEASPTQVDELSKLEIASPLLRDAFDLAIEDLQSQAKSGDQYGRTTIEIGRRSLLPDPE